MGKVAQDKSGIVAALPEACSDELAAVEFMERQRWGKNPACPRCGDADVYQMRDKNGQPPWHPVAHFIRMQGGGLRSYAGGGIRTNTGRFLGGESPDFRSQA